MLINLFQTSIGPTKFTAVSSSFLLPTPLQFLPNFYSQPPLSNLFNPSFFIQLLPHHHHHHLLHLLLRHLRTTFPAGLHYHPLPASRSSPLPPAFLKNALDRRPPRTRPLPLRPLRHKFPRSHHSSPLPSPLLRRPLQLELQPYPFPSSPAHPF